jgi:hypothetical protein
LSLSPGGPILDEVMGKVIRLSVAHKRMRRANAVFADFGELASLERAQLRLFAACALGAALLPLALQLVAR